MRFEKPTAIMNPGESGIETGPGPAGDDWLSRINLTINNFRELVKLVQQVRGEEQEGQNPDPRANPNPPARAPDVLDYVQLAIKAGHGDTTIGKIIEEASPLTLNQIMGVIKRVGTNR